MNEIEQPCSPLHGALPPKKGHYGKLSVRLFPHSRSIDKLFNRLFAEMESLHESENPQDTLSYRNIYGSLQLAIHHLATCRNLLNTHLDNQRIQAKAARPERAKKSSISVVGR